MSTERQSPDTILDLVNLTGVVSAIQDDPDSPDGAWLTAISNNANSICRVSLPTPTGNPTVGAGLQEFRVLVRKMGGTGTPEARIELWENGVLIREGTLQDITTDTVINFTWNANELGTPDGSLVECRLYGKKSGGGPSARATIEVGAVEWNVEYDEAGEEHSGSGSISGNGSLVGTPKKGGKGSALKSAGGTLLAIGLAGMLAVASIAGGGTQVSVGKKAVVGDASVSGGGSQVGIGEKAVSSSTSISGGGSLVATGQASEAEEHSGTALISGNGTLAGVATKQAFGDLPIVAGGLLDGIGLKQTFGELIVSGGGSLIATGQSSEIEEHSGSVVISGGGAIEVTAIAYELIPGLEEYCIDLDICRGKEFDLIICKEKKISLNVKTEFLEELEI